MPEAGGFDGEFSGPGTTALAHLGVGPGGWLSLAALVTQPSPKSIRAAVVAVTFSPGRPPSPTGLRRGSFSPGAENWCPGPDSDRHGLAARGF